VTGQDLDLLKQFLNVIPPRQSQEEQEKLMQEDPEYLVGF
jgi:GTPase